MVRTVDWLGPHPVWTQGVSNDAKQMIEVERFQHDSHAKFCEVLSQTFHLILHAGAEDDGDGLGAGICSQAPQE